MSFYSGFTLFVSSASYCLKTLLNNSGSFVAFSACPLALGPICRYLNPLVFIIYSYNSFSRIIHKELRFMWHVLLWTWMIIAGLRQGKETRNLNMLKMFILILLSFVVYFR